MSFKIMLDLVERLALRVRGVEATVQALPIPKDGADGKDGVDGISPDPDALVEQVLLRIPSPKDGVDGVNGRDGLSPDPVEIAKTVLATLPSPIMGVDGEQGPPGPPGPPGPRPRHRWNGTKLSFEKPDGEFGREVDLQGPPGKSGSGGGGAIYVEGGGGSAGIDDDTVALDTTWSSLKIEAEIANAGSGPGGTGDLSYIHVQSAANVVWTIPHNMGKYPSVTVLDSAGDECEGDLEYVDSNNLVLNFTAAFAGKAYLN